MPRLFILVGLLVALSSTVCCRSVLQSASPISESPTDTSSETSSGGCTVVINEVVHKPEDTGDVRGVDFVELYNPCEGEQDLSGWELSDEDGNVFVMGEDGCSHTIGPDEFLVFFRRNPCSFEFGYTGVDKATLKNAGGDEVSVVEWGVDDGNIGRSWSAIPDGSSTFKDGLPTPGVANEEFME